MTCLEDRTLLAAAPTLTALRASSPVLTYGQTEVLTATVTTDPPGAATPTGGTVTFEDESTTPPTDLGTVPLVDGTATLSTTQLGAREPFYHPGGLTAVYSGDGARFAGSSSAAAAPFAIVTAAGSPVTAALSNPHGVAVDQFGNLFVADTGNNRVVEVDHATGVMTTVAGNGTAGFSGDGGPATAAELNGPYGVAADLYGNVFISDTGNNRIREVNLATGVITTAVGNGTAGFNGDYGAPTAAELNHPTGITVGFWDELYIADTDNNRIRQVWFDTPRSLYGPWTHIETFAGNGTAGFSGDGQSASASELNHPEGVATAYPGYARVFIADTGNNRIRQVIFTTAHPYSYQNINTIAGNGAAGFSGDGGPATAAELNGPCSVAYNVDGLLGVADTGNNRIRVLNLLDKTIATLAGNGAPNFSGDSGPAAAATVNQPFDITTVEGGTRTADFFIADTGNDRARVAVRAPLQVSVHKAPLTLTVDDQTMVQGQPVPPLTYTVTGFVNGDTAAVLDGTPKLSTNVNSTTEPGDYPIIVQVSSLDNYSFLPMEPATATITVEATPALKIKSTDPVNGYWAPTLPNGQVTITFNHPLAGLTDGGPALGPDDPYAVMLIPRGPGLHFAAASGIDGGTLPVHANTIYHTRGTISWITITPLEPLATDVYLIAVDPSKFTSTDGYPLTDPGDGYRTFMLQPLRPSDPPLQVTGVTERGGTVTIANNSAVPQPDTIAIAFNRPLYAGAANGDNVQLIGPNDTVVPSLAVYSPSTQSIYLTPEALLEPGTVYTVRVDGAVSDDQNFSHPGTPLGVTFTDAFTVTDPPAGPGQAPLRVAQGQDGTPLVVPSDGTVRAQALGYVSVAFTEPLDLSPSVFQRFSARLAPWTVGSDGNRLLTDVPLNMKLAFNPNTNQLIIVPTVLAPDDRYNVWLETMQATTGDPLWNGADQSAGVNGPPVRFSFGVNALGGAAVRQSISRAVHAAARPIRGRVAPASSLASHPYHTVDHARRSAAGTPHSSSGRR